jgi:hypothetical protein
MRGLQREDGMGAYLGMAGQDLLASQVPGSGPEECPVSSVVGCQGGAEVFARRRTGRRTRAGPRKTVDGMRCASQEGGRFAPGS